MKHIRYLQKIINEICFEADKMALVSGPRQCGKTTMAKLLLKQRGVGEYYNWDEVKFRRQWTKDPELILPPIDSKIKPLIILDELHKAKLWKRNLKGLYDTQEGRYEFLITGSARLNVYRKGGDSLLGRYYHFRLHPFSVAELLKERHYLEIDNLISKLFNKQIKSESPTAIFDKLYQFGPFPEPLFAENSKILQLWQRGRIEKIVREDLRDLSRLPELSQVEMLVSLLPERASQPLSIKSLSEDLEVAYTTTKRWLNYLNELYYFFNIKPYAKSIARAIKKEKKLYLWDWSEIENKGARFENLIASHLLKYCDYLTDIGIGNFELSFFKNKEGIEIDFLILKNKKIVVAIEAKYSEENPCKSWFQLMPKINCQFGIQLVITPNIYKVLEYTNFKLVIISASTFLQYLI